MMLMRAEKKKKKITTQEVAREGYGEVGHGVVGAVCCVWRLMIR